MTRSVGFDNMKKNILTACCVLTVLYAFLALPNLRSFVAAARTDSGMTYEMFARPFKAIDSSWTEKQVITTFGEPDRIDVEGDVRTLLYKWHDFEFTWYLGTPAYAGGGVNVCFRNGKMFGTGWSDSLDDKESQHHTGHVRK